MGEKKRRDELEAQRQREIVREAAILLEVLDSADPRDTWTNEDLHRWTSGLRKAMYGEKK